MEKAQTELFSRAALRRLILPLLIEQTLAVTVGIADTMMVSYAGEAAVSGVSLVDMLVNLIFQVFAALATGGAVVTSQFLGARRRDKACDSAGQLLLLSAGAGLGVMALALIFARPLLRGLFGRIEPDVMDACLVYLRIGAVSFPFLAIYNAGAALFRSMGNSKISMKISLLVNLVNITGNAVCIFGLHMGVAGVALPSLVSRALGALLILRPLADQNAPVSVDLRAGLRLERQMVGRILHIGVPSAFENSLFQLGRVLLVSLIAQYGTVQIAANAVANNLDNLGIIPGQAYGLAMITVIGQCIGARDTAQARRYTRLLMGQAYLILGSLNAGMLLGLPLLLRLYSLSGETLALASLLVWIHAGFAILLWPASFVLPNVLRAANDVRFTMTVSVLSMAFWRVGMSYFLSARFGLGAEGVWAAMVLDWVCRTACFTTRYFSGRWQTKYVE